MTNNDFKCGNSATTFDKCNNVRIMEDSRNVENSATTFDKCNNVRIMKDSRNMKNSATTFR